MEIYKLSDQIPEKRRRSVRGDAESVDAGSVGVTPGAGLTITDMRAGVKNPNRVNVFVEKQFAFSLDVAQVVEFKLKVGRVLTDEELVECKRASEYGKLYQRALEWVLARPRSEREVRDYLVRKLRASSADTFPRARLHGARSFLVSSAGLTKSSENASELSKTIIAQLVAKGYVDDRKFAEWWVENRLVNKGVSRKRLQIELMKKGITREIIEEVLDGRNDEEEARKMIAKKQGKYNEPGKLVAYLCRQGFSYDLAKKLVEEMDE